MSDRRKILEAVIDKVEMDDLRKQDALESFDETLRYVTVEKQNRLGGYDSFFMHPSLENAKAFFIGIELNSDYPFLIVDLETGRAQSLRGPHDNVKIEDRDFL